VGLCYFPGHLTDTGIVRSTQLHIAAVFTYVQILAFDEHLLAQPELSVQIALIDGHLQPTGAVHDGQFLVKITGNVVGHHNTGNNIVIGDLGDGNTGIFSLERCNGQGGCVRIDGLIEGRHVEFTLVAGGKYYAKTHQGHDKTGNCLHMEDCLVV